jgi:hypothetical protein
MYVRNQHAWPISREEIGPLFERAGFALERLNDVLMPGASNALGATSGPTTPRGARYAQIVAVVR